MLRYVLFKARTLILNASFLEEIIIHANKEPEKDRERFMDESTGLEMEQATESGGIGGS